MRNRRRWWRWGVGLALALVLIAPPAARAQVDKQGKAAPKMETEIEEITVTAQKREENIQEIPISVTALGTEKLRERGVASVVDIGQAAPNVRITSNPGSGSSTTIAIRGVAQGNPSTALQTASGLYVDGVYIAKISGSNIDLEDLDRVEVLRGPQGTLYGRNTIAGAVNFVTKKPTEERSATVQTEVGNFDTATGRMTLNVPLIGMNGILQSDTLGMLSLRQTVVYKSHDGYFRNQSPTSVRASGASELNDLSRIFTMTAVRWQPTEALTIDYSGEYHRYRNNGSAFQLTYIYPRSPVSAGPFELTPYVRKNRVEAIGNNTVCQTDMACDARQTDDGNHRMHIATVAYELGELGPLGRVTLKSISSYRDFVHEQGQDLDGSPLHILDFHSNLDTQHWSQELQWVGTAPRINYVVGAYYYGEHSTQDQNQVFFNGANNLPYTTIVKTKSYAPFGQVTYTPPILNDKLSVTAGIRYTQDQVHVDRIVRCVSIRTVIAGQPLQLCNNPNLPAFLPRQPSWNDWKASRGKAFGGSDGISPMGNLSYQATDDLMLYARIARGFRGGGFNGTTNDPRAFVDPFLPEKLLQYEAGFKSQWLDNRVRLNAAGFYSDYTDLQQSIFRSTPETGAVSIISNVDSAEIWGSELEIVAMPVRGLEGVITYSFAAPKFLKYLDQRFDANGRPMFDADGRPVLENVAKQRAFSMTPQHQATAGVTYSAPPTSHGTFSAHVDVYWQDKVVFVANNQTAGAQAMEATNYAVVNGRLQFVDIPLETGSLDLAVFGRNLFDKKYRSYGIDFGSSLGLAGNQYGTPRTFGLQLTYNWSAG